MKIKYIFALLTFLFLFLFAKEPIEYFNKLQSIENSKLQKLYKEKKIQDSIPYTNPFSTKKVVEKELMPDFVSLDYSKGINPAQFDYFHENWIKGFSKDFDEMIDSFIKIPDYQTTQSIKPDEFVNKNFIDPKMGIDLIDLPKANNKGIADVQYEINIPKGRNGMEPSVLLKYDQNLENGWMGAGWDFSTDAIEIDTRWGAPRFDNQFETETYLMDDEQLIQENGALVRKHLKQPRSGEQQYRKRAESDFKKIIRHGNSPDNYWWEVIDKRGVKSFYGGLPNQGVIENFVLRKNLNNGPISHWSLVEKRDLNNNFISYQYEKVQDSGLGDGTTGIGGQNLYIRKITYTGHANQEGKYSLDFLRDRNLGEPRRKDVNISARFGFKKVSADLLRRIVVNYNNQPIRSYHLNYQEGAFFKNLLKEIVNYDSNGEEIAKHTLEYYDDVRQNGVYEPYLNVDNIALPNSELIINVQQLGKNYFSYGEPSAISGVRAISGFDGGSALNNSFVFFGACAVVFCPLSATPPIAFTLSGSVGTSFGIKTQEVTTAVRLQDINGDNLPDRLKLVDSAQVSRNQTEVTFAKLKADGLGVEYKDTMNIDLRRISLGRVETGFSSVESRVLFFAGTQEYNTINRNITYLSDVNGDGLSDLVSGTSVQFNCIPNNKRPIFDTNVACTPNPILAGKINDDVFPDLDDFFPTPTIPEPSMANTNAQKLSLQNKGFEEEQDSINNNSINEANNSEILENELSGNEISASEREFNSGPIFGGEFSGVTEITLTKSQSITTTVSSASSDSESERALIYRDINGDDYPDILSTKGIQYTNSLGQIDDFVPQNLIVHSSKSNVTGDVYDGAYLRSNLGRSSTEYSSNTKGDVHQRSLDEKNLQNNLSTTNLSAIYTHTESDNPSTNNNTIFDEVNQTLCDINGDALLDKCNQDGTVELGTGYGFLAAEQWGYLPNKGSTQERGYANNGVEDNRSLLFPGLGDYSSQKSFSEQIMKDLNGDGLPERIEELTPQGAWVRFNLGSGFSDRIFWKNLTALESSNSLGQSQSFVFSVTIAAPFTAGVSFSLGTFNYSGFGKQEFQLSDINGDGFPDLIESNSLNQIRAKYSTIKRTNLLKKVTRPLGSSFMVDYSREGNSYSLPSSKWVMSKVEQNQSSTDPTDDGYNNQLLTYKYGEGFYNRHDREFFGFDSLRTFQYLSNNTNEPYRIITELFDNQSYFNRGKIKEKNIADKDGKVLQKTTFDYALFDLSSGSQLPNDFEKDIRNVCAFSGLVNKVNHFYTKNSNLQASTTTKFTYDLFGNIQSITSQGLAEDPSDDYIAKIQYHLVGASNLLSIPQNITVEDNSGKVLRYRSTEIDGSGNITAIHLQIKDPTEFATYNLGYDVFGNLSSISLPPNHINQNLTYNFGYDGDLNTYIARIEDSYGYISTSQYDSRFGKVTKTVDMNNQAIEYDLDNLGRTIRLRGPNEIAAARNYLLEIVYNPNLNGNQQLSYIESKYFDPEFNSDILAYDFIDSYQRHLQNKKFVVLGDHQGNETNTFLVSGKRVYDELGRLLEEYQPTTESGNPSEYSTAFDLVKPIKFGYDILDRITSRSTHKDEQVSQYIYNIKIVDSKNVLSIVVEDPKANREEFQFNTRGKLISYTKPGLISFGFGNKYNYLYSPTNQLVESEDSEYSYFRNTYDMLGRLVSVTGIDNGKTDFVYDSANNLIQETNEYLRQIIKLPIEYTYDFNRLTKIEYPKNFQNDVEYYYGSYGSANNRAGKIELLIDASGGREFSYGLMGEVIEEVRTIVASLADIFTYKTNFTYDSWNRIQTIIYPDTEVIDYFYNLGGKPFKLTGDKGGINSFYVTKQSYNKFGNPIFREYSNNTTTRYWYDENLRKTRIFATTKLNGLPNEIPFFDENYTYDDAYNLLEIGNDVTSNPTNGLIGGKSTQKFSYDNQNRLVNADGTVVTFGSDFANYNLSLSYNFNDKITSKNQTISGNTPLNRLNSDYNYVFGKVNRLFTVSNANYKFDLNGNLSEIRNLSELEIKQFLWDEKNNLKVVNDNGTISQYTYDADGNRIIKSSNTRSGIFVNGAPAGLISHSQNYTIYINKYINTTVEGFSKHYFFGNDRVVSKNGNGNFINSDILLTNRTAGNFNYFDRFSQFASQFNDDLRSLGIPPGPPTLKGLYGQPDYVANSSSSRVAKYENGPSGPPGVPTIPDNIDDVINIPVGEVESLWYHTDFFDNSVYISNSSGQTNRYIVYNPLGEIFVDISSQDFELDQEYLYKSTEYDRETGLHLFGNNFYRPSISNWLNSSKK